MLYLETQKGKKDITALDLQQDIRGIDVWMEIIMKTNKGCGKLSSNNTLFSDSWFIRFIAADKSNAEVVDYYGPVKTSHKDFS